jgi:hypothetical protein
MLNVKNLFLFFKNFCNSVLIKFKSIVNILQNEASLLDDVMGKENKFFTDNNTPISNSASYAFNNRQRHS